MQLLPTLDAGGIAVPFHVRSKGAERNFPMIAGADRLVDRGLALRQQSGKEDTGLYLGAGYFRLVMDRREGPAVNFQRRPSSFLRLDSGSHLRKRSHDARHGPPRERFVAEEFAAECLASENAAEHAHGRARIPAVQRMCGFAQPLADTLHFDRPVFFPLPITPQSAHAAERAGAILGRGKILEPALALGDRRQHGITVGDGLIAGNANRATHRARRTNNDIRNVRLRIIKHEFNITEISDRGARGERGAPPSIQQTLSSRAKRGMTIHVAGVRPTTRALVPLLPAEFPPALPARLRQTRTSAFPCRGPSDALPSARG